MKFQCFYKLSRINVKLPNIENVGTKEILLGISTKAQHQNARIRFQDSQ